MFSESKIFHGTLPETEAVKNERHDLPLAMSLVAHDRSLERFVGDDVVPCDNLTVQYNRGTRQRILLVGILGRCFFN
jgi:hypothetical protein